MKKKLATVLTAALLMGAFFVQGVMAAEESKPTASTAPAPSVPTAPAPTESEKQPDAVTPVDPTSDEGKILAELVGGDLSIWKINAKKGEHVTATVTAEDGKEVTGIVLYKDGELQKVEALQNGREYTAVVPSGYLILIYKAEEKPQPTETAKPTETQPEKPQKDKVPNTGAHR